MDPPRHYYSQPSGAAQMAGSQSTAPAAPVSIGEALMRRDLRDATQWISQVDLTRAVEQTGWDPEWILALILCRTYEDPAHPKKRRQLPFELCRQGMSEKFGGVMNQTSWDVEVNWVQRIRPKLPDTFRAFDRLDPQRAARSGNSDQRGAHPHAHGRDQRSSQYVHALPYGAPQPGAGPSYGGSQSGHSGWYGAPQPGFQSSSSRGPEYGHADHYSAFQQGPGGPYPNTQGTNQNPPWPASSDPTSGNRLPGIESFHQESQMPPPSGPSQSMPGPGYDEASGAMAPGMQEPMDFHRDIHSRLNRGFRFSVEQNQWLLDEGMYVDGYEHTWERVRLAFVAKFPGTEPANNGPSAGRLQYQFNKMRT